MYRIDVGQSFNQSLNTYLSTPIIVTYMNQLKTKFTLFSNILDLSTAITLYLLNKIKKGDLGSSIRYHSFGPDFLAIF